MKKQTRKVKKTQRSNRTIRRSRGGGCGCSSGNLRSLVPLPSQYKMF